MRRRATLVLAALGMVAAVASADAQTRRATITVSVRVVRAPSPAVSSADTTQVSMASGLASNQTASSQAAPGQPEPIARTDDAETPQPGLARTATETGPDAAPAAELPGFRTVTINY